MKSEIPTTRVIEELKTHASSLNGMRIVMEEGATALVVIGDHGTAFIRHDSESAQKKLDAFIRQGAQPIGFITPVREGGMLTVKTKLLSEHQGDEAAQRCLDWAAEKCGERWGLPRLESLAE